MAEAFIQQVSISSFTRTTRIRTQLYVAIPTKHSPLEDEPWQDDDSYWDALQVASKDPATFEKFIEDSVSRKKGLASNNNEINGDMNSISSDNDNKPKKKGKYVPIEEWDANRNLDDMTNEERLQWECQRNGNQYRQNEILMNNLKGF